MNAAALGAAVLMLAAAALTVAFLRGVRVETPQASDEEGESVRCLGSVS